MAKNAKNHEERPWGTFTVLSEKTTRRGHHSSVEKIITVKPLQSISLQSHELRSEDWEILRGNGTVTLDDKKIKVKAGSRVNISVNVKHRIRNDSNKTHLIFYERTHGFFDEHDIIRYEDNYNRDSSWKND